MLPACISSFALYTKGEAKALRGQDIRWQPHSPTGTARTQVSFFYKRRVFFLIYLKGRVAETENRDLPPTVSLPNTSNSQG